MLRQNSSTYYGDDASVLPNFNLRTSSFQDRGTDVGHGTSCSQSPSWCGIPFLFGVKLFLVLYIQVL